MEGQILETQPPQEGQDLLDHYLRVVAGKTGSLIATSARYGAMFAGAEPKVVAALTEYGERVGVAFQLSDDILDVGQRLRGVGQDARDRPARRRAHAAGPAGAALHGPGRRPAGRAARRPAGGRRAARGGPGLLRSHDAMEQARSYVLGLAREAGPAVAILPESPAKDALVAFAELIATRTA